MVDTHLSATVLLPLHERLGGRIVPFAGYQMPIQFEGILAEHHHTRTGASLFDVSHMGQVRLFGKISQQQELLETLTPSDVASMVIGQLKYSVLLNEMGGIVDDCMIVRHQDGYDLVVNASGRQKDILHLKNYAEGVGVELLDDLALLAVQGPSALETLAPYMTGALQTLKFMHGRHGLLFGVPVFISRSGYTGEDGVEISVKYNDAVFLAEKILELPEVKPAGLGARDTLRLEAGLPLYGQDLDAKTNPVTAGLTWVIAKNRRELPSFLGASHIATALEKGPLQKRIGVKALGKQPLRSHVPLYRAGLEVGMITSGGISPTLGVGIGMGYINTPTPLDGLSVKIREQFLAVSPVSLPFVPHRYFKN